MNMAAHLRCNNGSCYHIWAQHKSYLQGKSYFHAHYQSDEKIKMTQKTDTERPKTDKVTKLGRHLK